MSRPLEGHCIPGIGLTDVDHFYGHGKVLEEMLVLIITPAWRWATGDIGSSEHISVARKKSMQGFLTRCNVRFWQIVFCFLFLQSQYMIFFPESCSFHLRERRTQPLWVKKAVERPDHPRQQRSAPVSFTFIFSHVLSFCLRLIWALFRRAAKIWFYSFVSKLNMVNRKPYESYVVWNMTQMFFV